MVARYDEQGIQFAYPDNWSIADEELTDTPRGVSVQSPSGAYWDVKVFSRGESPAWICDQALQAMREVYENIEAEPVTERMFGLSAMGYDLDFFCLDFLVTTQLRCVVVGQRVLLLTFQAESQEFERHRTVFDAITKSLLGD
jgi:hypothetical protein